MYDNAIQEPVEANNAINLCLEPASAVKETDEAIAAHVTEKNRCHGALRSYLRECEFISMSLERMRQLGC
ncbi:hypothetical protein [Enterobacter cloacae]|uniref:hypothetical protein n=1 Tax=Enterobacter cloacae TaxID=550 RepID=UPI001EE605BC|nr:hypothetical protein [Enterobacter cloacae]UKW22627.1 hypothetical protein MBA36_11035 [Enterobacter cloacae]